MKVSSRLALCLAVFACLISSNVLAGNLLADLSITKDDGVANATPGTQISYTIVASNAGPSDAAGTWVTDTFPASLTCTWTCTASAGSSCTASDSGDINDVANILAGGTVTYTATCDIDPAATGTLSNTASVSPDALVTDPDLGNNSATDDDTLVPSADLAVSKSSAAATVTPGGQVTYTVVAENAGPSAVTDAVVTDTFQAPLQNCSWTSVASGGATGNTSASGDLGDTLDMPVGSSVSYDITCDVDPAATGDVSNTASIASATVADPNAGNDSATEVDSLVASADLGISKASAAATAAPGGQVSYTVVAENAGPSAVTDAVVTDTFQAPLQNCSWTSAASGGATGNTSASGDLSDTLDMPVGSSVSYDITCDVDPAATGDVSNTATIDSATVADPNAGNDSATEVDSLVASADLGISKTSAATTVTPGGQVSYTVVAENAGPSAVTDAVVTDTFQAPLQNCSWTSVASGGATGNTSASGDLGDTLDMPVGSSVSYDITCDVDPAATGDVSNTASIASATVADPNAGNDSATETDGLGASADLAISKTDGQTQHAVELPINYTIVAQNNGPSAVSDAVVTDTFQAPLQNCSWTSAASGGATGNTSGSGDLSDTLDMPVGSSVTYNVTCEIDPLATGNLSNTATISSATAADPDAGNSSATDSDTGIVRAPAVIPTLSTWSILVMLGMFALFGGLFLRRQLV